MANEFRKVTDKNGVDHPVTDQGVRDMIPSGASSSNKMATASDVTGLQDNIIANTKLIKDTVGWSGKNKIDLISNTRSWDTKSGGGIDVTNNHDGTFAYSGTPTERNINAWFWGGYNSGTTIFTLPKGKYKVIDINLYGPTGTVCIVDSVNNVKELTLDVDTPVGGVRFPTVKESEVGHSMSGTLRPMIYDAAILDSTYEPYFGSTAFPRSEQAVLGAKNLLDIIATSSGIFTVNDDKTITANGAVNERTVFYLRTKQTNYVLNKGTYTVSIADNASVIKCVVDAYNGDTWVKNLATTTTNADFSVDYNGYNRIVVYLLIDTADIPATINNIKLSPMIRLATDTDPTYQPYAMTNRELTDKKWDKTMILASGDLDDYKTAGMFYWSTTAPSHSPENLTYCKMIVFVGAGSVHQVVLRGNGYIAMRQFDGSEWKDWYKVTTTVIS